MIKTFEELKAYKGKDIFMERDWAGLVTFQVKTCLPNLIEIKSTSMSGYNMDLRGSDAIKTFESYTDYAPIFTSKEEAWAYARKRTKQHVESFVEKYGDDKEKFIQYLIEETIEKLSDPEYGNDDTALAVKAVAEGYYPNKTF